MMRLQLVGRKHNEERLLAILGAIGQIIPPFVPNFPIRRCRGVNGHHYRTVDSYITH